MPVAPLAAAAAPRHLRAIRSALALPPSAAAARALAEATGEAPGLAADVARGRARRGLPEGAGPVFVSCVFSSPLVPEGPQVVVASALVDSGSSDLELHPRLLRRLGPLPVVASGAVYETSIGGEAYEAHEVLLTVGGRTCAAVVTCTDEASSDDALVGHMALGALGLIVDCPGRTLVPLASPTPLVEPEGRSEDASKAAPVRAAGPSQSASIGGAWAAGIEFLGGAFAGPGSWRRTPQDEAPRWLPRNAAAVELLGLALDEARVHRSEGIPQTVKVTYTSVAFASPLAPEGPFVVVEQALVDTGAADCELREGLARRLGRLPLIARGLAYETVAGRVAHDTYEVLVLVGGRACAAAVTIAPEARFDPDGGDPCTDEAVLGFAALAAMRLAVDCAARGVRPLPP